MSRDSMRLPQNGPTQRSNLFESHWSNQWLTSPIVKNPREVVVGWHPASLLQPRQFTPLHRFLRRATFLTILESLPDFSIEFERANPAWHRAKTQLHKEYVLEERANPLSVGSPSPLSVASLRHVPPKTDGVSACRVQDGLS